MDRIYADKVGELVKQKNVTIEQQAEKIRLLEAALEETCDALKEYAPGTDAEADARKILKGITA